MNSPLGLFILNTVLVPGATLRLHVFEDRYKALMAACIEQGFPFGVLLDRKGHETGADLSPVEIGTSAVLRQVSKLGAGRLYVIASGVRRFKVDRIVETTPFWRAQVSYLGEPHGSKDTGLLRDLAVERFRDYLEALLAGCGSEVDAVELPTDAAAASYIIADAMQIKNRVKQLLLESASVAQRLRDELALLEAETRRLRALRTGGHRDEGEPQFPSLTARFSRN